MMPVGVHARRRNYCHALPLRSIGVVLLASAGLAFGQVGDDGTVSGRTDGRNGWSADVLPSPTTDPSVCGHPGEERLNNNNSTKRGSFLCDPDGLLTSLGTWKEVEALLEDISSLQSPCGDEEEGGQEGIEGGVAVVSRMLPSILPRGARGIITEKKRGGGGGGGGRDEGEVTAEQFARGVQDSWGVGKKRCDNGFVLVASREDRSFAISVGTGLEQYLTPRDRNAALNAMKPLLREGDWDAAVLHALDEIRRRLRKNLTKAGGGGGGGDGDGENAGPLSLFSQRWEDIKRRAAGGGGGGGGGGDAGGGGGGIFGDRSGFEDFFGTQWPPQDLPPGSMLLALSLLWGGAAARASLRRRRYTGFETKLAGIEAQRAMLSLPAAGGGGWLVGQDALASPGACPICLDAFSAAAVEGGAAAAAATTAAAVDGPPGGVAVNGGGGGLIGADGVPTATSDCGHTFCQSCLSRWHDGTTAGSTARSSDSGDLLRAHDGSATDEDSCPCPICDAPTPELGDPRLGRPNRRLAPRRGLRRRRRRPNPRPARRRSAGAGIFGFRWPGSSGRGAGAGATSWSQGGIGGVDLRFSSPPPGSSGGWKSSTTVDQGMLPSPIPPPPSNPPPPPPPPPPREIMPPAESGPPNGFPQQTRVANGVAKRGWVGATGGEQARERARREAAFRLASLGSQYPKFLDGGTVNRWLSKDYGSSWSRDPMLELTRPPEAGDNGGGVKKGSGWVSTRSSSGFGGGGERRSYGGGSSSSATGGGW